MEQEENKYILAPYFTTGLQNGSLFLGFGSIQKEVKEQKHFNKYLKLAQLFKKPHSFSEASQKMHQLGFKESESEEALGLFVQSHFLMDVSKYDKKSRLSRQNLYYNLSGANSEKVEASLKKSHVAILGCGGIGNIVSVNLATSGLGRITLIDDDSIELSNLTRQILFTEADADRSKVEVLEEAILQRASHTKVRGIKARVNSTKDLEVLKDVDLIIVSADGNCAIDKVNDFCVKNGIAYINVGYIQDIAVWGPFYIPGLTGCYKCQNIVASSKTENSDLASMIKEINQAYQAPSIGPINMLAAAHASLDIIKYLGKFGNIQSKNKRIGVWTHSLEITEQDCDQNPNCSVCASHKAVEL